MQGEMEDKCGIVGIHCKDESKNVASFVYYCLYAYSTEVKNQQELLHLIHKKD